MQVGALTYNSQTNTFTGKVHCRMLSANIKLTPLQGEGPNDPNYTIKDAEGFEMGAAWTKKRDDGTKFLSITIDEPGMLAALNVAAFPKAGDGNQLDIVWNRPRQAPKGKAAQPVVNGSGQQGVEGDSVTN